MEIVKPKPIQCSHPKRPMPIYTAFGLLSGLSASTSLGSLKRWNTIVQHTGAIYADATQQI